MLPYSSKEKTSTYIDTQKEEASRGQVVLKIAIITAPIAGLLGGLLNLIENVSTMYSTNVVNQAIIPIAGGLAITLLTLFPYYLFNTFIHKLMLTLNNVISEFNHICFKEGLLHSSPHYHAKQTHTAQNVDLSQQSIHDKTPYHYEFQEETGEVSVNIHSQHDPIKRVTPSSIANMYNSQDITSVNQQSQQEVKSEVTEEIHKQEEKS